MPAEIPLEIPEELSSKQAPENKTRERMNAVLLTGAAVVVCVAVGINAALSVYLVQESVRRLQTSFRKGEKKV